MENKLSEYEISIRICFPEAITKILKHEKDRFVAEYGSSYKSEPHITVYLDRYTEEGFPQLLHDLRELRIQPFSFSFLKPEARREEDRHRNLYVVNVSNKERIRELHAQVSEIAGRSPMRSEESEHEAGEFNPHITLGDVGFDSVQPDLAEIEKNLKELEGKEIAVSELIVFFYVKADGDEKFKLIEKVSIPF